MRALQIFLIFVWFKIDIICHDLSPNNFHYHYGPKGDIGPTGPEGDVGERGPRGVRGPKGKDGPEGERGRKGVKGIRGFTGKDGETGVQGPQGDIGLMGETGQQGPTGAVGPDGPEGERGLPGKDGKDGVLTPGPQGPPGINGLDALVCTCRTELYQFLNCLLQNKNDSTRCNTKAREVRRCQRKCQSIIPKELNEVCERDREECEEACNIPNLHNCMRNGSNIDVDTNWTENGCKRSCRLARNKCVGYEGCLFEKTTNCKNKCSNLYPLNDASYENCQKNCDNQTHNIECRSLFRAPFNAYTVYRFGSSLGESGLIDYVLLQTTQMCYQFTECEDPNTRGNLDYNPAGSQDLRIQGSSTDTFCLEPVPNSDKYYIQYSNPGGSKDGQYINPAGLNLVQNINDAGKFSIQISPRN